MRLALAIAAVAAIGGCAPQVVWTKPGATVSDFRIDQATCKYEADLGTPDYYYRRLDDAFGAAVVNGMRKGTLFQECMHARGYDATPVEQYKQQHGTADLVQVR